MPKIIAKCFAVVFLLIILGLTIYNYCPENPLPPETEIDYLLVLKSKRELIAYSKGNIVKTYQVALGGEPVAAKRVEGDKKTPEGFYIIHDRNPHSRYHKNPGVSYPDSSDIERARQLGKSAGSDIKIHGLRNGGGFVGKFHRYKDWTLGCIAVTNSEINELYDAVKIGSTIEIRP